MEASFKRAFIKDLRKIPENTKKKIEAFVFEETAKAENTENLGILKSITSHPGYFRKRIGDTA